MATDCPRCGTENPEEAEFCTECEYPLAEAAVLVNGRYRMTKPYVFSSFRAVYEAEDIKDNNRIFSVREFLPRLLSPGERQMARSQFESLMMRYMDLEHPNLAGVANFFIEGKYYYIVYDFINGLDITKHMNSHKIIRGAGYPEPLVSHWSLQICDLIDYLHHSRSEPVFLVDLKPAGLVFRAEDERLVFIDIGLSKILSILGPHYLITEDFQAYRKAGGNSESVGWDLFCMGNLMYYLLTGVDLLHAHEKFHAKLKAARPQVSDAMCEIVHKALGSNYQSGYSDIREIRKDLMELTKPLPLRAFDFYPDFVGERDKKKKIEWRNFLGNKARTNTVGLTPKVPVHMKWNAYTKRSSRHDIMASDEYVYTVSKEGIIYAVNSEGKVDWKFFICKNITTPGIAADNHLYFFTPNRELVAIEHGSNEFKWKLEMESSSMAAPVLYEDILFVALYNGYVYAVNAEEGRVLTQYKVEGNIISTPIVHENVLYVTSLNKLICAIDIDTEETLWQYESETGFSASPAMTGRGLYVGSHDGTLCAVGLESGQPLWTRNFRGSLTQAVRATADMLYLVSGGGRLTALDPERGGTIWEKDVGKSDSDYSFCLGTNMLFIIDGTKHLCAIDAFSGQVRQRLAMSHSTVSQLISAHSQLYFVSTTGHLVAFGK